MRSLVRSQLFGRLVAAQLATPSAVTSASTDSAVRDPNWRARPVKKRFTPQDSPSANPATTPARPRASFAATNWAFPKKTVTTVERSRTVPSAPTTRATMFVRMGSLLSGPAVPFDGAVGEPEPQRHEGEIVDDVLELDPPLQERHEVLRGAHSGCGGPHPTLPPPPPNS